jgi:hypothetical protein
MTKEQVKDLIVTNQKNYKKDGSMTKWGAIALALVLENGLTEHQIRVVSNSAGLDGIDDLYSIEKNSKESYIDELLEKPVETQRQVLNMIFRHYNVDAGTLQYLGVYSL